MKSALRIAGLLAVSIVYLEALVSFAGLVSAHGPIYQGHSYGYIVSMMAASDFLIAVLSAMPIAILVLLLERNRPVFVGFLVTIPATAMGISSLWYAVFNLSPHSISLFALQTLSIAVLPALMIAGLRKLRLPISPSTRQA